MTRRVVLLGAPGAGKGTQARRVAEAYGMAHLSTGDLLRAAVAAGTRAGQRAKGFMDAGKLVPDDVVFGVLFERLDQGAQGFLLDGFPRNKAQASELDRRLAEAGTPLDAVVDIAVPDARLVRRITGRRTCKRCGRNYHVEFVPPARSGTCDECGGELFQRPDDAEAVVRQRLTVYKEQTAPLIAYYQGQGLLSRIDGDRPVDEVTAELLELLAAGVAESG